MRGITGTTFLACILGCAAALSPSGRLLAQQGGDGSATAPAAKQFDFLLGEWELTVKPKVRSLAAMVHGAPVLHGSLRAWRALDGHAIQDEMRIVDGSGNPQSMSGATRIYSPTEKRWLVASTDAYRSSITTSSASVQNGTLTLLAQARGHDGEALLVRSRYLDVQPDRFTIQQDRSADGGSTWDEATLLIEAVRTESDPPE